MNLTTADLEKYWDQGQPLKSRGNETIFSIHVRARQMLRKLGRRDATAYPKGMEFRFIPQKVDVIRQSIAHVHGDRVMEMICLIWDKKSVLGVNRDGHCLEYTYLAPIVVDDDDGPITVL